MRIPKKIKLCPIIESIVEIRFATNIPGEAIFGLVYSEFKKDFPELEKLPILQIPEQIRANDPTLQNKPYYKLKSENLMIQVGPKVFSIINVGEYIGWPAFSEKIYDSFKRFIRVIEIEKIDRLGIRYINMFKKVNIYEKSNLKISLDGDNFGKNHVNLTSNIPTKYCDNRLTIVNHAKVTLDGKEYSGSLIDIDTVYRNCPENLYVNVELFKDCLEMVHNEEKEIFYVLLDPEFLESLKPTY